MKILTVNDGEDYIKLDSKWMLAKKTPQNTVTV